MFRYLPEQASAHAPDVDWIHNLITDLSVFFTVAIVGTMIYFAIRYRRRGAHDHATPRIEGSHTLEVVWTVVPTIVSIFIAYYGVVIYHESRTVPENALRITIWGQKWFWDFEYEYRDEAGNPQVKKVGGKDAEWVVPVNRPVKVVMQSRDVLHSFFIPAMRVKKDAIPGQWTYLVFTPVKTGKYPVFCTEYCGKEHSNMMARLRVVSEAEFERWLRDRSAERALAGLAPSERGKKLYVEKGCNACHSLDGNRLVGPSFLKSYGSARKLQDGSEVTIDENYIQNSILHPASQVAEGYAPVMPSYDGQLNADEIAGLIAFIKAQDGSAPVAAVAPPTDADAEDWESLSPVERGERWVKAKTVPACSSCHSLDGSTLVGPSFKGIYGSQRELQDGSQVTADDAYLKESILNPMAKIAKNFAPAMPPVYATQLKEQDIQEIIEYLKTVK
jgi:cytochrome c oxidase subunit 2